MEAERGWVLGERESDEGQFLIRVKELEQLFPFKRVPERLNVVWSFRETGTNGTPTEDELDSMQRFEDRICERIEESGGAVLCIVFTEPGFREFVFYSKDVDSFLQTLSEMPQDSELYPIEIHHETDKRGEFYKSYASKLGKP